MLVYGDETRKWGNALDTIPLDSLRVDFLRVVRCSKRSHSIPVRVMPSDELSTKSE